MIVFGREGRARDQSNPLRAAQPDRLPEAIAPNSACRNPLKAKLPKNFAAG
jgi:hypothetical protein